MMVMRSTGKIVTSDRFKCRSPTLFSELIGYLLCGLWIELNNLIVDQTISYIPFSCSLGFIGHSSYL